MTNPSDLHKERGSELGKVAVLCIVDLNKAPWILSGTDFAAIDNNLLLTSDQGKWKE